MIASQETDSIGRKLNCQPDLTELAKDPVWGDMNSF